MATISIQDVKNIATWTFPQSLNVSTHWTSTLNTLSFKPTHAIIRSIDYTVQRAVSTAGAPNLYGIRCSLDPSNAVIGTFSELGLSYNASGAVNGGSQTSPKTILHLTGRSPQNIRWDIVEVSTANSDAWVETAAGVLTGSLAIQIDFIEVYDHEGKIAGNR